MTHRCLSSGQVEEVVGLPPGDPRREEAERCPRCRSLIRQYTAFATGAIFDPVEAATVKAHLRQFLDSEVRHGARTAGKGGNFWERLVAAIRARPLQLAGAAVAAAVVIVIVAPWLRPENGDIVLRGEGDAHAEFALRPVESAPGHVVLRWPSVPGAESYRIVIYDAAFDELVSSTVRDTSLAVPVSNLISAWQTAPTLQWEVEALRYGDVMARSEVGLLHKP